MNNKDKRQESTERRIKNWESVVLESRSTERVQGFSWDFFFFYYQDKMLNAIYHCLDNDAGNQTWRRSCSMFSSPLEHCIYYGFPGSKPSSLLHSVSMSPPVWSLSWPLRLGWAVISHTSREPWTVSGTCSWHAQYHLFIYSVCPVPHPDSNSPDGWNYI